MGGICGDMALTEARPLPCVVPGHWGSCQCAALPRPVKGCMRLTQCHGEVGAGGVGSQEVLPVGQELIRRMARAEKRLLGSYIMGLGHSRQRPACRGL